MMSGKVLEGRILVVDDEEPLREALRLFLSSRGYEVGVADGGNAALEELGRAPYDLVITDIRMPGMSGDELLEAIDSSPQDSRPAVIVMTAHGSMESAIKGIKAGISAYIRKPAGMDEVDAVVRTAVERRRLDRELKRYYEELDRKVEERTRELSLINAFSAVINRSFDLDVILDDAVDHLVRSLDTDAAWIYLMEGDPPVLRLRASRGFSPALHGTASVIDPQEGYSGATFRAGGSFIYDDVGSVKVPLGETVAAEGFRSAIHAAIKSGDKILGSMGVASRAPKKFQESGLQLLTSFGNQIGAAIDKITLYEREKALAKDLREKVNQLVILNEMGHLARVSNRLEEAAMVVVSAVVQGLGFDRVCLWLFDGDGTAITRVACQGIEAKTERETISVKDFNVHSLPLDDGEALLATGSVCGLHPVGGLGGRPAGEIVMAPLVTRNPENTELRCWEHFHCGEDACPAFNHKSLSCWMIKDSCVRNIPGSATLLDKMEICKDCPVYRSNRKGKNIGFLCADNKASGRPIDPDDVKLLNVFSNSAATVIENINLMEQLIKDERFIDSIIFNMSSGLLVTDSDGRVKMLNYAGAEILRVVREDVIGRDIVEIFPEARWLITVSASQLLGHEVVINTRDGPVPVGYSNSSLLEHGEASDGVIVVFRDLSEIKKLQDQLRERDRFAAIGKVAAGVAHEIRNPLFGITSVAQILAREVMDGTPKKVLIDAMLSETSRLNTLVEDMLLYGRTMKVAPQPVDLNALIESVLDFHMAGIREKDLSVLKDFEGDLPSLMLDPHQMRQVFLNVLVNALDASQKGGEIMLKTRKSEDTVAVRISDNGMGIPQEDLPKVFDLFYTTKEKGTGLGLAICRKIVEDHGGKVAIHSLPGRGTTVELMLPRSKA